MLSLCVFFHFLLFHLCFLLFHHVFVCFVLCFIRFFGFIVIFLLSLCDWMFSILSSCASFCFLLFCLLLHCVFFCFIVFCFVLCLIIFCFVPCFLLVILSCGCGQWQLSFIGLPVVFDWLHSYSSIVVCCLLLSFLNTTDCNAFHFVPQNFVDLQEKWPEI